MAHWFLIDDIRLHAESLIAAQAKELQIRKPESVWQICQNQIQKVDPGEIAEILSVSKHMVSNYLGDIDKQIRRFITHSATEKQLMQQNILENSEA